MREIKFRAWDKKQEKMLYDVHLQYDGHPHDSIHARSFGECLGKGEHEWDDALEIMQYTGLKDKNGKEIYEGDIVRKVLTGDFVVKGKENYTDKVVYLNGHYGREKMLLASGTDNRYWYSENEVIGNIYENPELIMERK